VTRAWSPLSLLLAAAMMFPAAACSRTTPIPAPVSGATSEAAPPPTPASAPELERYAEREKKASALERFEGGRMSETTLIVVILLVAIIIILLVD
jgi:hypothetical protein